MKNRISRVVLYFVCALLLFTFLVSCQTKNTESDTPTKAPETQTQTEEEALVLAYVYEASPVIITADDYENSAYPHLYMYSGVHKVTDDAKYRGVYTDVRSSQEKSGALRTYAIGERTDTAVYWGTAYGGSNTPYTYDGVDIFQYRDSDNYQHIVNVCYSKADDAAPICVDMRAEIGTYPVLEAHMDEILSWNETEYERYACEFLSKIGNLDTMTDVRTKPIMGTALGEENLLRYRSDFVLQIDGYDTEHRAFLEITPPNEKFSSSANPTFYSFEYAFYDLMDEYAPFLNASIDEEKLLASIDARVREAYCFDVIDWHALDTTLVVRDGTLKALIEVEVKLDAMEEGEIFDGNRILVDIATYRKADEVSPEDLVVSK